MSLFPAFVICAALVGITKLERRVIFRAMVASRKQGITRKLAAAIIGPIAIMAGAPVAGAVAPSRISNVAQLGDCMWRSHRATALKLLNSTTEEASEAAFGILKTEKTCFARLPSNSELDETLSNYSKGLMRGMVAEAALRVAPGASALRPRPLEQKRYVRPWFATTGRDPAVDEMSACAADADPHGILSLIRTDPNSSGESSVLADLQPWLVRCLTAGRRLEANRIALRAALADALYQRLRNPALSDSHPQSSEASK